MIFFWKKITKDKKHEWRNNQFFEKIYMGGEPIKVFIIIIGPHIPHHFTTIMLPSPHIYHDRRNQYYDYHNLASIIVWPPRYHQPSTPTSTIGTTSPPYYNFTSIISLTSPLPSLLPLSLHNHTFTTTTVISCTITIITTSPTLYHHCHHCFTTTHNIKKSLYRHHFAYSFWFLKPLCMIPIIFFSLSPLITFKNYSQNPNWTRSRIFCNLNNWEFSQSYFSIFKFYSQHFKIITVQNTFSIFSIEKDWGSI